MQAAPIPKDEKARLKSLRAMNILDTEREERFDRITRIAVHLFNVPISTVTLVDSNREWFKSCHGLDQREGDRAISFCGHALLVDDIFIIPDAKADERFKDNPMVVGEPYIRFYAGVPLFSSDKKRIGTFCIKDHKPKKLSVQETVDLKALAAWAEQELNMHELTTTIKTQKSVQKSLKGEVSELERMNKLMVDRELKMAELKEKLKACEAKLK